MNYFRTILLGAFFIITCFGSLCGLSNRNKILCCKILEIVSIIRLAKIRGSKFLKIFSPKRESLHSPLGNIIYFINANFIKNFYLLIADFKENLKKESYIVLFRYD